MNQSEKEALVAALVDRERLASGDKEYRDEVRHRCQTDGFFLAPLLGFFDFIPSIHQPVKDLYVAKKPGLPIEEQDTIKNRMHLDPRHTFKTTWGFIDKVQWIVTCPEVTMVDETATQKLGQALVRRTGKFFHVGRKAKPTPFQLAFPEFCTSKLTETYTAPCSGRDEVEPTLYYTSPGSSQSGWHPWIINPDDMVDGENSGIDASDDSRNRIWNTYTVNLNTLRHGGYVNVRGTRYHPLDAYGRLLATMDPSEWKTLIRSSLTVKSGERLIEGEFPEEDQVELHFPEMLPYKKLRGLFRTDYRSFMCQQQNDDGGGGASIWPKTAYEQMLIDPARVPTAGEVRVCWRIESQAKPYMQQYSEGVAVLYAGAKVYVIEAWRGVYTPIELCERIVRGCKRNGCYDVTIEQTPGSESVIPHIYNEATRQNWTLKIERPEFESDDSTRQGRIKNLQPMSRAGRLWIVKDCTQGDALEKQFTLFAMQEQNGLVDCISRLALRIPASVVRGHISEEQREMYKQAVDMGMWHAIFGDGGAVEVEQAVVEEATRVSPRANSYGLRPMLGGLNG